MNNQTGYLQGSRERRNVSWHDLVEGLSCWEEKFELTVENKGNSWMIWVGVGG